MLNKRQMTALILVLIAVGVASRLVPHMPNFAAVTATALFCGAYMSRRYSLMAPLLIVAASDYLLLYINPFGGTSFSRLYMPWEVWYGALPFVYFSFALSALVGWFVKSRRSGWLVIGAALVCSVQFFLITNAGVWLAGAYDRGIDGLMQSYISGLPFFRGTVLGDLFYTCVFFGAFEMLRGLVQEALPGTRPAPAGETV